MNIFKRQKSDFVILFVCLLVSCARVELKNTEWCGDLGDSGASCFNTHNDNSREIQREEWDKERFGMLCTKSENFAEWKRAIEKLCIIAGKRCTQEEKKSILSFIGKVNHYIYLKNLKRLDE